MISSFSIAKCLLDKTQEVATANGYTLVQFGAKYSPSPSETYIREIPLFGEDRMIGLADNDSDIQYGFYQINIYTPKDNTGGKWQARTIESVFKTAFKKGTELTHNAQMLRTRNSKVIQSDSNDTHNVHILSINYSVIN